MSTVLITGANRGIGLELTRRYVKAGHNVIATCRDLDQAHELKQVGDAPQLELQALEVTDADAVAQLASALQDRPIDLLINNAGVMGGDHQSVEEMDYAAWSHTFEVNTIAPFRLITALVGHLKRSSNPRAVSISSQMGSLNRRICLSHFQSSAQQGDASVGAGSC